MEPFVYLLTCQHTFMDHSYNEVVAVCTGPHEAMRLSTHPDEDEWEMICEPSEHTRWRYEVGPHTYFYVEELPMNELLEDH